MGPNINYYLFSTQKERRGPDGVNEIRVRMAQPLQVCQMFLYGRAGLHTAQNEIGPSRQAPAETLSVNGNRKSVDRLGR